MRDKGYELPDKIVCEDESNYMLVDSELTEVPFLPPGKTQFDNPRLNVDGKYSVEWHLRVLEQENVATAPIKTMDMEHYMDIPVDELFGWYLIKDPLFTDEPEGVVINIRFDAKDIDGATFQALLRQAPNIKVNFI